MDLEDFIFSDGLILDLGNTLLDFEASFLALGSFCVFGWVFSALIGPCKRK